MTIDGEATYRSILDITTLEEVYELFPKIVDESKGGVKREFVCVDNYKFKEIACESDPRRVIFHFMPPLRGGPTRKKVISAAKNIVSVIDNKKKKKLDEFGCFGLGYELSDDVYAINTDTSLEAKDFMKKLVAKLRGKDSFVSYMRQGKQ